MAELGFNFSFDPSEIIKAYRKGIEDCFIAMSDFADLESVCNINDIKLNGDNDDI